MRMAIEGGVRAQRLEKEIKNQNYLRGRKVGLVLSSAGRAARINIIPLILWLPVID